MSKRISPTVIGAFVVSSFAILVAALIVLGSGRMFSKPMRFVCMFQGNLNGLKIGAPVKVRGVQIGTVADIRLRLLPSQGQLRTGVKGFRLPVFIDLDRSQLVARGAIGSAAALDDLIRRGMRAQLDTESLLTGLLYIDLDIHPKAPADYVLESGGPYKEIPTVPTDLEQLQDRLEHAVDKFDQIDFNGLVASITDASNSIKALTSSPDLKAALASLKETMPNLNQTLISARGLLNSANSQIGPLVTDLRENSNEASKTMHEANETMKETRDALVSVQQTLDPNSPLAVHLTQTLDQLTETSQSIGEFTDYLSRNPSAVIRGKYIPDQDR
jgi:paraquat-inducible protein B